MKLICKISGYVWEIISANMYMYLVEITVRHLGQFVFIFFLLLLLLLLMSQAYGTIQNIICEKTFTQNVP